MGCLMSGSPGIAIQWTSLPLREPGRLGGHPHGAGAAARTPATRFPLITARGKNVLAKHLDRSALPIGSLCAIAERYPSSVITSASTPSPHTRHLTGHVSCRQLDGAHIRADPGGIRFGPFLVVSGTPCGYRPCGGLCLLLPCGVRWQMHRTARLRGRSPRLAVSSPVHDNAPSADRIVCRGRAGERVAPPRASVSDGRQPTEREAAAAVGGPATGQGGVWIRIASSRSSRRTRASALSVVPVWPGGPCVCWPTRRCCQVGTVPGGAIGPNFCGTLGRCRSVQGSNTKRRPLVCPGAGALWCAWPPTGWGRCCTALSGGRRTGPTTARPFPALGVVEPLWLEA
jgi:hypothetical protein